MVEAMIEDLEPNKFYSATLSLTAARTFADSSEPDIKVKCNTFIVIENSPAADLAFSIQMMKAPVPVDVHRVGNIAIFRGNFEGVWVQNPAGVATSKLSYIYGNDIYFERNDKLIQEYQRDPVWARGAEATAPAANTALATVAVDAGKIGKIYGFFISAQEGNEYLIKWTSGAAKQERIIVPGQGTTSYTDTVSINNDFPADAGTNITINNVNAGGVGKLYSAKLLVAEEEP